MNRFTHALLALGALSVAAVAGGSGCGGTTTPEGDCPSDAICNEPEIPLGCHLGEATCTNGVYACPPVVCPDAATTDDGGATSETDANAAPDALDAEVPSDGAIATAADASNPFFYCDSGTRNPLICDGRMEACKIVNGGPPPGINPPTCVVLPPSCQSAPTCTCVEAAAGSGMCVNNGGNFTVTEDVP
jgi:hypothetical protein